MLMIALLLMAFWQSAWAEPVRFNLGVSDIAKPSMLIRTYRPTLKAIKAELATALSDKVEVRMRILRSPNEVMAALQAGNIDFASIPLMDDTLQSSHDYNVHASVVDKGHEVVWLTRTSPHTSELQALTVALQMLNERNLLNHQSISDLARNNVQKQSIVSSNTLAVDSVSTLLSEQALTTAEPSLSAALPVIQTKATVSLHNTGEPNTAQMTIHIDIPDDVLKQLQHREYAPGLDANINISGQSAPE